jgi:hypothetical protein
VVAEQVAETPVLEANAEVPANPVVETPAESAEEEGPDYEALISTLDADEAPAGDADTKSVATGVPDTSVKVETAEEAAERGRREVQEQARKQQTDAQYQAYIQGLNRTVTEAIPAELTALATKYSMEPADVLALTNLPNRISGAYKPLYDHHLKQGQPVIHSQAYKEAETEVSRIVLGAINEELGEKALKNIQTAAPATWDDLTKAIAKEARNGYVSQEAAKKTEAAHLKKLDAALASRAREGYITRSLADLSGTGGVKLPQNKTGTARGGWKTKSEASAALRRGEITAWDMRAIRNDPSIPD